MNPKGITKQYSYNLLSVYVCSFLDVSLRDSGAFVQEFITNPMLIDGRYAVVLILSGDMT